MSHATNSSVGRWLGVAIAVLALIAPLFAALPGSAQEDPVLVPTEDDIVLPDLDEVDLSTESAKEDPLGLTPFTDFIKVHSLGKDVFEVWACGVNATPRRLVERLDNNLTPYFKALSRGRYNVDFVVGGAVNSSDFNTCLSRATARSDGNANAALLATPTAGGLGGPGTNQDKFPQNQRWAQVGTQGGFIMVAAHEIGHTLHFPHSYTGNTKIDGQLWEYDNALDVMSGNYGINPDGSRGTFNRPYEAATINQYAAGWIDQKEVNVIGIPPEEFVLAPTNKNGTKMAVLKHADGRYSTFEAAKRSQFNPIRKNWQGVAAYKIRKCPYGSISECWGKDDGTAMGFRRHKPYGKAFDVERWEEYTEPLGLVIRPKKAKTIDGRRISVRWSGDGTGRFRVRVSAGVFPDAKNSVFKNDIVWLTNREITRGCNPPQNTRFCPNEAVIRGEMAAFLHRALPNLPRQNPPTDFTDDNNSVFQKDIEWLSSRDVTRGCNPPKNTKFCPNEAVTRGEMAAFLRRALPNLKRSNPATNFTDDNGSVFEADIEWLSSRGITLGCNPPKNTKFCPNEAVERGEMAAFLRRALTD